MMAGFNPFEKEKRKSSPGEKEVERGNLLIMVFRYLGVPMPRGEEDEAAVSRAGILLLRWIRNRHPMLAKIIDRRL